MKNKGHAKYGSFSSCSEEKSPMVRFPDPSNTKTIGRMTCLCFLRPAPTLNILGANKVNYGKCGSGKLLSEEPRGSLLLVQREP